MKLELVKEYGPLHNVYSLYLLSYVIAMIFLIAYANRKKRLASPKYAIFLATAVLLNICVWARAKKKAAAGKEIPF